MTSERGVAGFDVWSLELFGCCSHHVEMVTAPMMKMSGLRAVEAGNKDRGQRHKTG